MTITVTCASIEPATMYYRRGDYVAVQDRIYRIVRITPYVLTTRTLHRWRWVERLRCRWEALIWMIRP